jgi:hypothetical protein
LLAARDLAKIDHDSHIFAPTSNSYIPISPSNELPTLFIDPRKLSPSVADYLSTIGVSTKAYSDVWSFLQTLRSSPPSYSSENAKHKEEGKIATSLTMSWAVELALGKVHLLLSSLPSSFLRHRELTS